jgi:hypothetical protein
VIVERQSTAADWVRSLSAQIGAIAMADIVINFQTFYEIDDTVARLFVAAGLARYLSQVKTEQAAEPHAPAAPNTDQWSVGVQGDNAQPVIILRRPDSSTNRYAGEPAGAAAAFRSIKAELPLDVLRRYEAAYPQSAEAVAELKRQQIAKANAAQKKADAPGVRRW